MVRTAAKVAVIRTSLLPVRWRARIARVSPESTPLLGQRRCFLGTRVEGAHPFGYGGGGGGLGTGALISWGGPLRARDERVCLVAEGPDGVYYVVGAEIVYVSL